MYADLHMHTHFSDGTFSPEELAGHGKRVGLKVMSLTDHDTIDGCELMAAACAENNIEFITGCEFTVEPEGFELHLLGYLFDPNHVRLRSELARFQEVRQQRIHEMVGRLQRAGVKITSEDVLKISNNNAPGRPHIGRALVAMGECNTLDEAFQRWLKKGKPAWVAKEKMTSAQAIELIHQAGGLAVIAHPGLYHRDDLIPGLVAEGMDGIECFYTRHSTPMTEQYLVMAEEHGLLVTGGSDCHGHNKGEPLIGRIKLPYDYVAKMKAAVKSRDGVVQ